MALQSETLTPTGPRCGRMHRKLCGTYIYIDLKREATRICHKKNGEVKIREREELEMLRDKKKACKFYQKVRLHTEGFKT